MNNQAESDVTEMPAIAWLHKNHPDAYCITDAVKNVWLSVDPKTVENYTIPLYAIPDTHCIVPKEPSEAMKQSGGGESAVWIYKSMIAASQGE